MGSGRALEISPLDGEGDEANELVGDVVGDVRGGVPCDPPRRRVARDRVFLADLRDCSDLVETSDVEPPVALLAEAQRLALGDVETTKLAAVVGCADRVSTLKHQSALVRLYKPMAVWTYLVDREKRFASLSSVGYDSDILSDPARALEEQGKPGRIDGHAGDVRERFEDVLEVNGLLEVAQDHLMMALDELLNERGPRRGAEVPRREVFAVV